MGAVEELLHQGADGVSRGGIVLVEGLPGDGPHVPPAEGQGAGCEVEVGVGQGKVRPADEGPGRAILRGQEGVGSQTLLLPAEIVVAAQAVVAAQVLLQIRLGIEEENTVLVPLLGDGLAPQVDDLFLSGTPKVHGEAVGIHSGVQSSPRAYLDAAGDTPGAFGVSVQVENLGLAHEKGRETDTFHTVPPFVQHNSCLQKENTTAHGTKMRKNQNMLPVTPRRGLSRRGRPWRPGRCGRFGRRRRCWRRRP